MMDVTIDLTDEQYAVAQQYAAEHGISLAKAFKQALFERIEDEYDLALAEEAHEEYVKSGYASRPIEELWQELGLEE